MQNQLNTEQLSQIPTSVMRPGYERHQLQHGIVHIGVGGFHRAHQALYTEDLMESHGVTEWGICGVGLRVQDKGMEKAMLSQDCLYTLIERHYDQEEARIIGVMTEYLFAPDRPQEVLEKMASSEVRIVSLTITEGGYCYNEATQEFDHTNPMVLHDLKNPNEPMGIFGFLAEALHRRKERGIAPFTIMSCDNIQGNGNLTQSMVLAFAQLRDPILRQWIEQQVSFPNSMVDRITPMTADQDKTTIQEKWGFHDQWPVVAESFKQWVIEDNFCNGRPSWEKVGVQFTKDVLPYEKMKIRLLNASHAAAAYLAYLDGFEYFHEALSDSLYQRYLEQMMDEEITPLLPEVTGVDLSEYKKTLIERFANPTVKDQMVRLCTDGSARMPKFLLPSIEEQLQQGGSIRLLSLAIAGWFRFLAGFDERGDTIVINDPQAELLNTRARLGRKDPSPLLNLNHIFGDVLPQNPQFVALLKENLQDLYEDGVRATLKKNLFF